MQRSRTGIFLSGAAALAFVIWVEESRTLGVAGASCERFQGEQALGVVRPRHSSVISEIRLRIDDADQYFPIVGEC
jgi:hypothetical protein